MPVQSPPITEPGSATLEGLTKTSFLVLDARGTVTSPAGEVREWSYHARECWDFRIRSGRRGTPTVDADDGEIYLYGERWDWPGDHYLEEEGALRIIAAGLDRWLRGDRSGAKLLPSDVPSYEQASARPRRYSQEALMDIIEDLPAKVTAATSAALVAAVRGNGLDSPAVLGWLLQAVREAWGQPTAYCEPAGREEIELGSPAWTVMVPTGDDTWASLDGGETEAEALYLALDLAPTEEVSARQEQRPPRSSS